MPKIAIGTHTIRVRETRSDDFEHVHAFGPGHDLLDYVFDFLESLRTNTAHDEERQVLLHVTRLEREGRTITGRIESGDYGYSADLIRVTTGEHTYERDTDEAELLPFFFMFYLPPGNRQGLMLLQTHGVHGIKTSLTQALYNQFREDFPSHLLKFGNFVPDEVLQYINNGSFKEIQLITSHIPQDIADRVRLEGNYEHVGHVTYRIQANRGESLPFQDWLPGFLQRDRDFHEIVHDPDVVDLKVTVDYNGTQRTISLANPGRITPHIDVTDTIDVGPDGHPIFDEIRAFSRNYAEDVAAQMGLE